VWNPAFDVTPAALIAGYVTDRGLLGVEELRRLGE
jgi:methylthioribose-1-phosphate isomerase